MRCAHNVPVCSRATTHLKFCDVVLPRASKNVLVEELPKVVFPAATPVPTLESPSSVSCRGAALWEILLSVERTLRLPNQPHLSCDEHIEKWLDKLRATGYNHRQLCPMFVGRHSICLYFGLTTIRRYFAVKKVCLPSPSARSQSKANRL
jgi:hypothetical protein